MDKVSRTVRAFSWFFISYIVLAVVVLIVLNITVPSEYSAKTKIFVTQSSNSALADIYDAPYTDRAVKTVTILTSGDDIIVGIAQATGIDPALIRKSFKAENVAGTQIIEISVTNEKSANVTMIAQAIPTTIDDLLKKIQLNTDAKNQIRVSVAEQPGEPKTDSSNKIKLLGEVVLLAIAIGYGLIYLLDLSDNTIKHSGDVERFDLRFLGNFYATTKIEKKIGRILEDRNSKLAEALREIRTNIIFSESNNGYRTLAITSPRGREGKTMFATALALVLNEAGKKVIIIDADLRTSGITKLFSFDNRKGLSDHFVDKASTEEIIHKTSVKDFFVIPSGISLELHLSTLFSHKSFPDLKNYLLDKFGADFIIIDSPSIHAASDTAVIAKNSDATIVITEHGVTELNAIKETKSYLNKVGALILGIIISKTKL